MAIEAKRGCGYRKVGGLYMVSGAFGESCHRLPFELTVCPCCGQGIKQSLGFTWVDAGKLFAGGCGGFEVTGNIVSHCARCIVCSPNRLGGAKTGLMWVGEKFYKRPEDFLKEGMEMGISKRIKAIPRDFKIGETFILLAHPKAVRIVNDPPVQREGENGQMEMITEEFHPGIFGVFRPQRVELLITEKQATKAKLKKLEKQGITPVIVPNNDPDHFGSVHDSKKKQKKLAEKMSKKK